MVFIFDFLLNIRVKYSTLDLVKLINKLFVIIWVEYEKFISYIEGGINNGNK